MSYSFTVIKALNNNVLIAKDEKDVETVLIHRGIGFSKKTGDELSIENVDKVFTLKDQKEQEQYKKLLPFLDEDFIVLMNDCIHHIQAKVETQLNEHIHIALTDHIAFTIKRIQQGLALKNPFLLETKTLYPDEYALAKEVVEMINKRYHDLTLPEAEIGFIALHIHSSITHKSISEVNRHSQLINQLITVIEEGLKIKIDRSSIHYLRLVRHLRFAIERIKAGEKVEEPKKLAEVLQIEYPVCYNLAWKVVKVMQQALKTPVLNGEAVYLTLHLQRLSSKNE